MHTGGGQGKKAPYMGKKKNRKSQGNVAVRLRKGSTQLP